MYIVFKNNKPAGNEKFSTYEKARQQARKWLRKSTSDFAFWRVLGISNPALFDGNYSIRKVG